VLLGDSFAVGSVRQDENFASRIEALRPDIEIYNFGVHAAGPEEYAALLDDEALGWAPDAVIVAFFVGNDAGTRPPPGTANLELEDHASYLFLKRTWRIVREWYRLRAGSEAAALALPQLAHPAVPQAGFTLSKQTYVEVEVERLMFVRRSQQPGLEGNWTTALAHLRDMAGRARERGIGYGVVIIPDEYQANPDVLDEVVREGHVPRADLDIDLPQRRVLAFCRAEGVACLDLLPVFAGTRDAYLPQDTHWNERGNRLAAEAIVPWLTASVLRSGPRRAP
jgi:hypothetical protein